MNRLLVYIMEKRVQELENYTDDLFDKIQSNMIEIANIQAYSRRENIEIFGIPDNISQNELETKIIELLNSIGVDVDSYEIASCHRLRKERYSKSSNVIVRFINRKNAFDSIKNSYKLKKLIYRDQFNSNLFIRENLCPHYKSVFRKCYALFMNNKINDVYTKKGKLFIQINENDRSSFVSSLDSLEQIKIKYINF